MAPTSSRPRADDSPRRLVIVGASLAGLRAAESARRNGYRGEVVIVGKERHLPYDRPPLSKEFLTDGQPPVFLHSTDALAGELGLRLRLGTAAIALDPDARRLSLDDDTTLTYDRLIVATGAAARRPSGLTDLAGIVTLRTLDDAVLLRSLLVAEARVVIVGAGLIGSELASSAGQLGAHVTLIDGAPVPLVRAVGVDVGRRLSALHAQRGIELICDVQIVAIEGHTRASAVVLSDGLRLPADVVLLSIGAEPVTSWLAGSGVAVNPTDGAIVCDEMLRTSVPAVYAAGDVAEWSNRIVGGQTRQENWSNANEQGAVAGRNAVTAGSPVAYEAVSYFWSDWYGQRIQFVGTADSDDVEFHELSSGHGGFVALYHQEGRLVGAAACNGQRLIMKYRRLIRDGASNDDALATLARSAGAAWERGRVTPAKQSTGSSARPSPAGEHAGRRR
ncbi:MAG: pyridine nucleotide-disulfide oxidoreductase [Pseudonocardiales bacterium]|nr:pyridine nucleotide-disulfide oxidoreductase [Pseudonocardiales bacterium]